MVSRYNLLYKVNPEDFDLTDRRFKVTPVSNIFDIQTGIESKYHRVEDQAVQEVLLRLDKLSLNNFYSPIPHFSNGSLSSDLNLEQVVDHLLEPRFTPMFQQKILANAPADFETTIYRQEGIRELIEKPDLAKGIEDSMEIFAQLVCSVLNRVYTFNHLGWMTKRRHKLKKLSPHNLDILQKYTAMVTHFSETLRNVESRPMQRLKEYINDIRDSKFFQDIFPVFDVSYYKDYRVTLDVTIGRDGVYTGSQHISSKPRKKIPAFKLISKSGALGFIPAFFKSFRLPTTYAMDAMNTVVQKNLNNIMKIAEIIGQIEFYTCGASFYRRMKEIGMPINLPEILSMEERKMDLIQARNPLLLYQDNTDYRNVNRVIPNDIKYNKEQNMFVITGSNNGGKTCYVKTGGLLQLLGQNGFPITAESGSYLSIVDDLFTHFITPDDLMAGEGRLLNELRRVEKIYRRATPFSYAILDEPCGGTEHSEGARQSTLILDGFHELGSVVYFTTHLHEVADMVDNGNYQAGKNLHVEIIQDDRSGRLVRTFRVLEGKATLSYGVEVAKSVGLTKEGISGIIEERTQTGAFDRSLLRR